MKEKTAVLRENKKQLREEINSLIKELEIKKMDFEQRNKIQKIGKYGLNNRNGIYEEVKNLVDYETRWKDSFYVKNRLIAEEYGAYILSQDCIKQIKQDHFNMPFRTETDYCYSRFAVFCEACIPTPNGPILKLSDPYGSIFTEPIDSVTFDEANEWIDRILVAYIGFNYRNDKHPLKGFKKLNFTLYKDLRKF